MAIDYGSLRSLTAPDFIAALMRDGFYFVRQRGSHQRYRHPDGRRVTVAPHGSGGIFNYEDAEGHD
jgi:predicted RNA binding protein YcfA (HicA-like mRNA interferase family)